jgi:hypothetical protein
VIAAADASVRVKLGMAAERLTLDLSECDLLEVPPEAFDITNLEVSRSCDRLCAWCCGCNRAARHGVAVGWPWAAGDHPWDLLTGRDHCRLSTVQHTRCLSSR